MSSILQQTLRGLCFDTGWCYAVFWKLKQQPRAVLTWENAFYGGKLKDINAGSSFTNMQICGGFTDMEDPIALAVSKMSYHVYSVGEGIIGRVAFTNTHQWVFNPNKKGTVPDEIPTSKKANQRVQLEKYPTGWEHQFASGIKTIAVIAVPQGVVQLGSTHTIAEDLKLIGHAKALFGTLQTVPGAFLSDFISEVKKGAAQAAYPWTVPPTPLPSRDPALLNIPSPSTLSKTPNESHAKVSASALNNRLPMILASQQLALHASHSVPLLPVLGLQEGVPHFPYNFSEKPGSEPRSQPYFPFFRPFCTWPAGTLDTLGLLPQPVIAKTPYVTASTVSSCGVHVNRPLQTDITRCFSLPSKVSSTTALPFSKVFSPSGGHRVSADSSCIGGKGVSFPTTELLFDDSAPHLSGKPVSRIGSPQPAGGDCVAAELCDVSFPSRIQNASSTTVKETLQDATVRCELGNIPKTGYTGSLNSVEFVSARAAREQPSSEQSASVILKRVSAESPQRDGGGNGHAAKRQCLDSIRCSTESRQLDSNPCMLKDGQLDCDSGAAMKKHGLVEIPRAGESQHIVSPSKIAEISLLDAERDSIQTGQVLDKHKHHALRSEQNGGSDNKHSFVCEKLSEGSSQQGDNTLSISTCSILSAGLSLNTVSTVKQESCMSEHAVTSAKDLPLHCEQNLQAFAPDSSHGTGPMSDLFCIESQFEVGDGHNLKELMGDNADFQQGFSSSLLCDIYSDNLESAKSVCLSLEGSTKDFGSTLENSVEMLFTNELNDFEDFFASLTKVEDSKSVSWPCFASETDEGKFSAPFSTQDITREMSQYGKGACGSAAFSYPYARLKSEYEPILCDQTFSNCVGSDVTLPLPCNDSASIQCEPQFEPNLSFRHTDGNKELVCQETTPLPSRLLKTVEKGKKRLLTGDDARVCLSADSRQRVEDRIRKLRTIVPHGARCSIDLLLDKTVEYMEILQSKSQESSKQAQGLDGDKL